MTTLPSDPVRVPGTPARHGLLPPALRRDLADLNGQFLDLSLADGRGRSTRASAGPSRSAGACGKSTGRRGRGWRRPRSRCSGWSSRSRRWRHLPSRRAASPTCRCPLAATTRPGRWTVLRPPGGLLRAPAGGRRGPLPPTWCSTSRPRPSHCSRAMSPSQLAAVAAAAGSGPAALAGSPAVLGDAGGGGAAGLGASRLQWAHCVGVCLLGVEADGDGGQSGGRRPATAAALTSLPPPGWRITLRSPFARPSPDAGPVAAQAHEDLPQRRAGAQGHRPRRRAGRLLRAARPERRRQDHRHRHHRLAGQQDLGAGAGVRPRHRHRARGREGLPRPRAAGDQLQPVREGLHDPRQPGGLLRHPAPGGAASAWSCGCTGCSSGTSATRCRARCPAA